MIHYDIIIVGGGIAGLYIQNKLLKKYKNILLIEKDNRLGGRILTFNKKIKGVNYSMEGGAGRFNKNHKCLLKLIKEFGLNKNIFKIPSSVNHISTKSKWKKSEISKYSPYEYIDYILSNINLNNEMRKLSFNDWLNKNIDENIIAYLKDFYPYKDMFKTSAYDALNLYKTDLNITNNFYVLGGGLSLLIDGLKNKIKKQNGKIKLNTELKNIKSIDNFYVLKTTKCNYICNNIILTAQQSDLIKIKYLNPIKKLIKSVRNTPLSRYYFIFDTKKCSWFKNIKKTITDSKLSYFIPIDYETGLVMISYVDEHNALFLKKLEKQSKKKLVEYLLKECEKIFNIKDIPDPIYIKSFHWESGVGNWKHGNNSNTVERKMIKPMKDENVFICGENYSAKFQGWIEGSLQTSENVIKLLN